MLRNIACKALRSSHLGAIAARHPGWHHRSILQSQQPWLPPASSSLYPSQPSQRMFSNFSDRIQGEASKLFRRSTKVASEALQKTKDATVDAVESQAKKAGETIAEQAGRAYKAGSKQAAQAYREGASAASEVLDSGKSVAADALRSTTSTVSKQVHSTSKAASEASYRAVSKTGEAIRTSTRAAASATTDRIRSGSKGVVSRAQDFGHRALRWLFGWSLAAIFVYGLATSIPSALIRHAFSGNKDDKKIETPPLATQNAVPTNEAGESRATNNVQEQGAGGLAQWFSRPSNGTS